MSKCPYCNSTNMLKNGLNSRKNLQRYKCKECGKHSRGEIIDVVIQPPKPPKLPERCAQCQKPTSNPKFCSSSCSATYNNLYNRTTYGPSRKQSYCRHCGVKIEGRRKTCDDCNPNNLDWSKITIAEIAGKAKYQVHSQIRQRARYRYRTSDRPKYCVNCGYSKHIEICHIHAIADFPDTTNVAEINDLKNLVALCPNCHWDLDNGELQIEDIRGKNNAID